MKEKFLKRGLAFLLIVCMLSQNCFVSYGTSSTTEITDAIAEETAETPQEELSDSETS